MTNNLRVQIQPSLHNVTLHTPTQSSYPHVPQRSNFRTPSGVSLQHVLGWDQINLAQVLGRWEQKTQSLFKNMTVCAICGHTCLGGATPIHRRVPAPRDNTIPPYAFSNNHLSEYTHTADNKFWYVCSMCSTANAAKRRARERHIVFHPPAYTADLLAADDMEVQQLSIVDLGYQFVKSTAPGYASASMRRLTMMPSTLITQHQPPIRQHTISEPTRRLWTVNKNMNPIVKQYLTVLEMDESHRGLLALPYNTIQGIVQDQQERCPLFDENPVAYALSTFTTTDPSHHSNPCKHQTFELGETYLREVPEKRQMLIDVEGNNCDASAQPNPNAPNLEAAVFPFLFPDGAGFHSSDMTLCEYIRMRSQQLFSNFTLYKPYNLLMYQFHQSHLLLNLEKERNFCLDRDLAATRREHPTYDTRQCIQSVVKHKLPTKLMGSPKWHAAKLKDLLTMVNRFGMPSHFITLTCDEFSELRWPEFQDMETILRAFNTDFDWKDAPVEGQALFNARVEIFLNEFLFNKKSPLLGAKVLHHLVRYEWQNRGSCHVHIIIWLEPEAARRVTNEICAYVPYEQANGNGEAVVTSDANAYDQRIRAIYKRKQLHRCSPIGCGCKKFGDKCKDGFPFEPCYETHMNEDTQRYEYYRPYVGFDENAISCPSSNRNIVPTHPLIALLWNAHTCVLAVTAERLSFYLLKYTAKVEPMGSLKLDSDVTQYCGFGDISESQLQLINAMVITKPVSACEAAFVNSGNTIITTSDTVHYMPTSPPAQRIHMLCGRTVCIPAVELYTARPACVEDLTLYEYFQSYVLRPNELKTRQSIGRDRSPKSNYVYHAPPDYLIRFTDFHPIHQMEAYFYNVLLRRVHFRSEEELLTRGNMSYFMECYLRRIFTDAESLTELTHEYSIFHLYTNEHTDELVHGVVEAFESLRARSGMNVAEDPFVLPDDLAGSPTPTQNTSETTDFRHEFTEELNGLVNTFDQSHIISRITGQIGGMHVIMGCPGGGKSYVLKRLIQLYREQDADLLITASTGAAARRLSMAANTYHTTCRIPPDGMYIQPLFPSDPLRMRLRACNVLIIEEFSMMTSKDLQVVIFRLLQAKEVYDFEQLVANMTIIICGDEQQLPPVCRHSVQGENVCMTCHITNSVFFQSAQHHVLTVSLRHATDPLYAAFLNIIRIRKPTQEEIDHYLSDCIIERDRVWDHIDEETTIITSHVEPALDYNDNMLERYVLLDEEMIDIPTHTPQIDADPTLLDVPQIKKFAEDKKFNKVRRIKRGCTVMLTKNYRTPGSIDVTAVNGSLGTVVAVSRKPGTGVVHAIRVRFADTNEEIKFYRSKRETMYHNWRPFHKSTFPLMLGYAMTVHKSQGATIRSKCMLDLSSCFCAGQAYVAFSRVTDRKYLKVVGRPKPEDFIPIRTNLNPRPPP
jgi:hypothetical protein